MEASSSKDEIYIPSILSCLSPLPKVLITKCEPSRWFVKDGEAAESIFRLLDVL